MEEVRRRRNGGGEEEEEWRRRVKEEKQRGERRHRGKSEEEKGRKLQEEERITPLDVEEEGLQRASTVAEFIGPHWGDKVNQHRVVVPTYQAT
jgi:hypothetical protein